jgi:hypothetical protein
LPIKEDKEVEITLSPAKQEKSKSIYQMSKEATTFEEKKKYIQMFNDSIRCGG